MSDERIPLAACVRAATNVTPLIVRGAVNAAHASKPFANRQRALADAIRHTRALLAELELQQQRLGWRDREGDAA